ncbi:hypothetical protein G8A07_04160 [Roseateles sp. DAIF2]|uniref:hypothetical protein n=1 Tax=Roseateles sp. DAIF2 TaxID=2714952 RepID=UPI0018A2B9F3|nr:hypothetical protein [Roseateles sp. DAIF2]QPF72201.1 hypothetical protein G8A07_04160 [Roseateles sp. DAIF2]
MLKLLRSLLSSTASAAPAPAVARALPPTRIAAPGVEDLLLADLLTEAEGLPFVDWARVHDWVARIPEDDASSASAPDAARAVAWTACERAWLEHLRAALGAGYRIDAGEDDVLLLSTLEPAVAAATRAFVSKTRQRVVRLLDGVAEVPAWGHEILIVFEDEASYYRYVSFYYPEAGEFAASGGMYINQGCGHFLTVQADLRAIEPVIAHELTHACLGHLPLPAWLNEGLAVNTEQRLCPPPGDVFGARPSPQEMHARHQEFWGAGEIQEFWSGRSFLRADQGNELSYDLARILVAQLSAADWARFRDFVLAANLEDAGAAAARAHLGMELADLIAALLEQPADPCRWAPDPRRWEEAPERGAFAPPR